MRVSTILGISTTLTSRPAARHGSHRHRCCQQRVVCDRHPSRRPSSAASGRRSPAQGFVQASSRGLAQWAMGCSPNSRSRGGASTLAEHDIPTGEDELEQEICHHGFLLETPSLADFESQHGVRLRHRIAPGFAGRRAVEHYLAEYHASSMTDGKAAMEKTETSWPGAGALHRPRLRRRAASLPRWPLCETPRAPPAMVTSCATASLPAAVDQGGEEPPAGHNDGEPPAVRRGRSRNR